MRLYQPLLPLLALLPVACTSSLDHSNYYIDATAGSDSNAGTSPEKPWKTFAPLASLKLSPGDSLLLRRGSVFDSRLELSASGSPEARIVVDAYGEGDAPRINAPDSSLYAVRIRNSDWLTLQNIEIVNTGSMPMARRTGVSVVCENYGQSRGIVLNALNIHDVNGSLVKEEGGGSAILISNRWDAGSNISVYDSLRISDCVIRRCQRNALIWDAPWSRTDWHPNTNVLVTRNLIEQVPGDGIVPIGCDGAVIEYNLMRDCPMTLPDSEAAAGIWPWSCDNTVVRFNEASDHKAPWDAQGFDSDYNCRNTTIEYNYSHDNDGGFLLVCNNGDSKAPQSVGNVGTVVRYNISIGDAVRQRPTRVGKFSPTLHFAGPTDSTPLENNIFFADAKPSLLVDRHMVTSDSWGGHSRNFTFRGNVFLSMDPSAFSLGESTGVTFDGNYYIGTFSGLPADTTARPVFDLDKTLLPTLLRKLPVGNGTATLTTVDPDKITAFFKGLGE